MPHTAEEILQDRFAMGVIHRKAKQLIENGCFPAHDHDAIVQDLLSNLIVNWDRFDENLSHYKSFVCTIVDRFGASLARNRKAEKRRTKTLTSLNAIVGDKEEGLAELSHSISDRDLDRRLNRQPRRSDSELSSLAHDLKLVIAKLPPDLQMLLERRKTQSIAEICRDTGLSRSTVTDRLESARDAFEKANLQKYF